VGVVFVVGQSLDLSAGTLSTPAARRAVDQVGVDCPLFEGVAVESADPGPHRRTPSRSSLRAVASTIFLSWCFGTAWARVCGSADI
jgi:hypothetical protein